MWSSCWMSGVFRRSNGSACRQNDWRLARASSHMSMSLSLTPPCRRLLLYTSPTTTSTTSTCSSSHITARQLFRQASQKYNLSDYHTRPRNKPETAVATRPQVRSHHTNSPPSPSQHTNNSSDRQKPSTGSLSLFPFPVGTAHTPLNKP
jgi:hypothetical protein